MRVGIIGCGKITQVRHIPEYLANENAEIAGYFDPVPGRAQGLADQFGGKAYKSVDEMLADPTIDAVSVCCVNFAHAENTIKALASGKHVLCEKPMAITSDECLAMTATAKVMGKHLLIGHNQRILEAHQLAKKLIEEGLIGDIVSFHTTFGHGGPETWSVQSGNGTWFFNKKSAVLGAFADLGIHKTDAIRYITGQNIIRATGRLTTLDKRGPDGNLIDVEDNAICIYELENGAIGTMTASWTHYGEEDNSTEFWGTKGIMKILRDPAHAIVVTLRDGTVQTYDCGAIQTNDNQTKSGVIDEFVAAVTEDRPSVLDAHEILNSMMAVFAGVKSSETGTTQPVALNIYA